MKIAPIEVTLIGNFGNDLNVVNAARVSFEKESSMFQIHANDVLVAENLRDADVKLINYLAKHKHFSPFNHAFLSFRVKAPIFVARQLVKHKFMPWNEVSRRYVDSEPEFYIPAEYRSKADNVKQGSADTNVEGGMYITNVGDGDIHGSVEDAAHYSTAECLRMYEALLHKGVCPEQARMVLPLNTMTEWIWSGTLGAFADMLRLRLDPHSQKESRDVANLIYDQAFPLFPVSFKALLGN